MSEELPKEEVLTERQREYAAYKDRTKRTGKPFFPYAALHDAIASAVVLAIIILLSVVWFSDAACGEMFVTCEKAQSVAAQEEGKPLLGPLYEEKAEPSTTQYHPRPEWYFYFLFQLLIIFKNPQTVLLGTIGLPTIGLVLLMLWPFLDRKKERRPSRRPIAMVAMVVTAISLLALSYQGSKAGDASVDTEKFTEAQQEMPGFELIVPEEAPATCRSCHALDGAWTASGPGPDLTKEADKDRGVQWQVDHLKDPPSKVPGSTMPPQTEFSEEELQDIAEFLETLGAPERAE